MGGRVEPSMRIDTIDRIIHEPARFMLMAHLSVVEEADFVFLMRQTGLSAGNAGAHLKKLGEAGYVSVSKTFVSNRPQTMFSATEKGLSALSAYRDVMSGLLDSISP